MKNEDVLKEVDRRFDDYKEFMAGKFEDQNRFVDLRITGLSGIMRDNFDQAQGQREEIIEHQKITNSRVTKLETETKIVRWITKNAIVALIVTVLLSVGILVLVEKMGIETILKLF